MMETKFTKGPWITVEVDGRFQVSGAEQGDPWTYREIIGVANAANAHLIASAPDMYTMLENLYDRSVMLPNSFRESIAETLMKARGEK